MSGALHPALGPIVTGGGTPARLAAAAGAITERMGRMLLPPPARFLDEDGLAALTDPPEPGEALAAVLARLGGVAAEEPPADRPRVPAGLTMPGITAAAAPLPADIVAHARAAPLPQQVAPHVTTEPMADVPSQMSRRVAEVRHPEQKRLTVPPPAAFASQSAAPQAWHGEAARLGSARPIRVAVDPPKPSPATDPAGAQDTARHLRADISHLTAEPRTRTPAIAAPGASPRPRAYPDASNVTPLVRPAGPATVGDVATPAIRSMRATAGEQPRLRSRADATSEPAARPAGLRAVSLPDGARVGGFAGLAALGRAAPPEAVSAAPAPASVPERAVEARALAPARPAEQPPAPDARAVIAELADVLRLQILAAGIDPSGRRP